MWIVQVMTKMLWYFEWVIRMTHTNIKGLPSAPISVKTPLFIPTVFLQLKIASNESILGLLFFKSRVKGTLVWVIQYESYSMTGAVQLNLRLYVEWFLRHKHVVYFLACRLLFFQLYLQDLWIFKCQRFYNILWFQAFFS